MELTSLKKIMIHSDSLESIPRSIGNLTELESLWIFSSTLSVLPDWIGELASLTDVVINSNSLESIVTVEQDYNDRRELRMISTVSKNFPGQRK